MQIHILPKFVSDNHFLTNNSRRAAPQRQAGSTLGDSALKQMWRNLTIRPPKKRKVRVRLHQ